MAVCDIGLWSLDATMARSGWALNFEEYSGGIYRLDQEAAQAKRAGLWQGEFVPPWEWRRR